MVGNSSAIAMSEQDNYPWRVNRRDEFWKELKPWQSIPRSEFSSPLWQEHNSLTNPSQLSAFLSQVTNDNFLQDAVRGVQRAPMSIRLSPYLLSLMDWQNPYQDPLRRQFLPVSSELAMDHPLVRLDSTSEQKDSPTPGLVHRYYDRVLFLTTNVCPVYCRFCTRSYSIGLDTDRVIKLQLKIDRERWSRCFEYIRNTPQIEDVVISGGDVFRLKAQQISLIADTLLSIPHVKRLRFATKGLAVLPMKISGDSDWLNALTKAAEDARRVFKEVVLHTHFNHPNEITGFTEDSLNILFSRGIAVRNLSVMLRGVNDNVTTMTMLCRRLTWMNVRPYYSYMCDMVIGIEDLRFPLSTGLEIERGVRGALSGPYTPLFVVDPPGGCGKRSVHSFELYDKESGLSVYSAPSVKARQLFLYADPLHSLSPQVAAAWLEPKNAKGFVSGALARIGASEKDLGTALSW